MARHRTLVSDLMPLILDLGCCGIVALQLAQDAALCGYEGSGYDLVPQEANALIVAGRVTHRFAPLVQRLYGQLASPQWVIAVGTCALTGAVFDTLPLTELIPVDISVPGCPPLPDAIRLAVSSLRGNKL